MNKTAGIVSAIISLILTLYFGFSSLPERDIDLRFDSKLTKGIEGGDIGNYTIIVWSKGKTFLDGNAFFDKTPIKIEFDKKKSEIIKVISRGSRDNLEMNSYINGNSGIINMRFSNKEEGFEKGDAVIIRVFYKGDIGYFLTKTRIKGGYNNFRHFDLSKGISEGKKLSSYILNIFLLFGFFFVFLLMLVLFYSAWIKRSFDESNIIMRAIYKTSFLLYPFVFLLLLCEALYDSYYLNENFIPDWVLSFSQNF